MKTERIVAEIEKTKTKIGELQARVRDLERQKTELENTEIIGLVRALEATPAELAVMLRAMMESQRQQAMTSLAPQITEDTPNDDEYDGEQEDADDEE